MTKDRLAQFQAVRLGIFAKPPRAGLVKTRLIPDIGADNATAVYRQCLQHALSIAAASGLQHCCYLTEVSDDRLFAQLQQLPQTGDDLGQRMLNAFTEMLEHSESAIIIGTDCLDMTPEHLQQAADLLQHHDLVVQPVFDGGYSLIGCRRIEPAIFSDVRWSSDNVLSQTLLNAGQLGYRVARLETVRDIDTVDDLKHYPQFRQLIPA